MMRRWTRRLAGVVHGSMLRRCVGSETQVSPNVTLTPSCVDRLREITSSSSTEKPKYLRLLVDSGGCSGFEYKFELTSDKHADDMAIAQGDVVLLVDELSLGYVDGATIDYQHELIRSAFKVSHNPLAEKGPLDSARDVDNGAAMTSHLSLIRGAMMGSKAAADYDDWYGEEEGDNLVTTHMLVYCFDVLHSHINCEPQPHAHLIPNKQFPLFVTWKTGGDQKLRGCIGTFNSTSLPHALKDYTLSSAFKDNRFSPISQEEVPSLHCSVSLLTDFEPAQHYMDWQIGRHGIRIEFTSERGAKRTATYLPEVAPEQGWSHIETIDSLMRKGGYKSTISEKIRLAIVVVRFQSHKKSLSYSDYVAHKRHTSGGSAMGENTPSSSGSSSSSNIPSDYPTSSTSSSNTSQQHMVTRTKHGLLGPSQEGGGPPEDRR